MSTILLRNLIRSLIAEGKVEDLAAQHPEIQPAIDAGIRNHHYLNWILRARGNEPVEDVIGVVKGFLTHQKRLAKRDINQYSSASELRAALEALPQSRSERKKQTKESNSENLGTFGEWHLIVPLSKTASCLYGKGTQWCTAATRSENMFYHYTTKNNILIYAIGPNEKISLGVSLTDASIVHGKNMTVNSQNYDLSENDLRSFFGDQFSAIMSAVKRYVQGLRKRNPVIHRLLKMPVEKMDDSEKRIIASNSSTPVDILRKLASDKNEDVRYSVAGNPNMPVDILRRLASDKNEDVRYSVAGNPNTPVDILRQLASDKDEYVRYSVAKNLLQKTKHIR